MERLSTHQFMVLSSAVLLGTTFFSVGSLVVGIAGRDGWMAILPGFILGIPFGLMLLSMVYKYPNKNLIEISERVLGKWIGKGLGLLYIFVTSYLGGLHVGQGVDMYNRTILPLMPRTVLIFGGFFLVFYLFISGIEVLGRFAEVVFPVVTGALILMALFTIPRFEQGELYPILADGMMPVLKASMKVAPWPMEYILFLAGLLPFLSRQAKDLKQMKKGIWRSVFFAAFLITITVLIQIQTFGPFETVRLTYGLLVLDNMIEISRTIAGVESIFTLVWMGALIIKITACFFAGMWGIRSVFGLKNLKWSFVLGLVYVAIPMFISRGIDLVVENGTVDDYLILPFAVVWVLLVWGVDKWKSRSKSF